MILHLAGHPGFQTCRFLRVGLSPELAPQSIHSLLVLVPEYFNFLLLFSSQPGNALTDIPPDDPLGTGNCADH
jgi:hypothetical protein